MCTTSLTGGARGAATGMALTQGALVLVGIGAQAANADAAKLAAQNSRRDGIHRRQRFIAARNVFISFSPMDASALSSFHGQLWAIVRDAQRPP